MRSVGVLTISDRASAGEYDDVAGPLIANIVQHQLRWSIGATEVIPDEMEQIKRCLIDWSDSREIELILTTGGTGFSPRDITPEATQAVIERVAPGLAEAMRAESLRITPHAMLSRAVCGIRGRTLINNLPGSPKAVRENLAVLIPVLPHALDLLNNDPGAEAGHYHRVV